MKDEGSIKAALSDSQAATACNRWTQQMEAPAGQQGSDHHTAYSVRSSIERPAPRSAQEPPQLETIDVACTFNRRLCMYRLLAIFHPSRFGLMRVRFQQPQAEAQQVLMVGTSDPAYPAYLFSCWADLAQDPYKRSLSRAVRKRKEVASAVEQEPEVAHFESCANSCADHDTPESAHEDDPGADDDTHESKHDDDSCPLDPAPVMAEPVPHFAGDFQAFQQ